MLKTLHRPELLVVAAGTFGELATVNIVLGMALATVLPHTAKLPSILMTLAALESLVDTDQLKVLVESSCFVPTLFCMARGTLFAKSSVVDIFVTGFTVPNEQILKDIPAFFMMRRLAKGLGRRLMAFNTFHVEMQSLEYKPCDVVIKWFACRKFRRGMAFPTWPISKFLVKLIVMLIFMTCLAVAF